MLSQRLATAAVGVPIIICLIFLGGAPYVIAVGIVLILAALEFFAAAGGEGAIAASTERKEGRRFTPTASGIIGGISVAAVVAGADAGFAEWTGLLAAAIIAAFVLPLARADAQTGLLDWLVIVGGVAYVGYLGSHLVLLRQGPDGTDWTLLALLATFATDTTAYFVGRAVGSVRIAPDISPGKTLEGSLAGLGAGFLAVLALYWVTDPKIGAGSTEVVGLALALPIAAMIGDLAESLIKRGSGVKDTSALVPGHGGFLDRLDSVLFTAPLVYYFVQWFVV